MRIDSMNCNAFLEMGGREEINIFAFRLLAHSTSYTLTIHIIDRIDEQIHSC